MGIDAWTIGRMLSWMEGYLDGHGDGNALVSTRWLLSDVTGLSFMELYTNFDRPLSPGELDSLRTNVKRRAQGEPIQYITGKTSFRHIDLAVREGVLIPRPETEVLVSEVLKRLPSVKYSVDAGPYEGRRLHVADLCTGSGCIACSLAFENPAIDVVATDISDECVSLARGNARALGLSGRVEVVQCDLGELAGEGPYDAIVSNPPYVPSGILEALPFEVSAFEPTLALDGGEDGLDLFRRIAEWSIGALTPGGFLAVELHETTLDDAAFFAESVGYDDVDVAMDLAGKPRVLIAYRRERTFDGRSSA